MPMLVSSTSSIHSAGIYSLDYREHRILTASKDSRTVFCSLATDGTISAIRSFDAHHHGHVIKCVRSRDQHVFADCGNSSSVCVFDLREPASEPVLRIEEPHGRGTVNVLEWHPTNEHLVLTTGRNVAIALHDLRRPTEAPTRELLGHIASNLASTKSIYRPLFLDRGRAIVSPGERYVCSTPLLPSNANQLTSRTRSFEWKDRSS